MKKIIIGIIAIVIVTAVVIGSSLIGSGYWENDWGDDETAGVWGVEILLHYADGSTESIKELDENLIAGITYGGEPVAGIEWTLSAKASGSEYTDVDIDLSGFYLMVEWQSNPPEMFNYPGGSSIVNIPVDDVFHEIMSVYLDTTELFYEYPDGNYGLTFSCEGTLLYQGHGIVDTEWLVAELPTSGIGILLSVSHGTLSFSLEHGIDIEIIW